VFWLILDSPVIAHSTAQRLIGKVWAKVDIYRDLPSVENLCVLHCISIAFNFMSDQQATRRGEWTLLVAELPERRPQPIGVLFADIDANRLYVRLKQDWWADFSNQDDAEVWRELTEDLEHKAKEMGAVNFLDWLQEIASHTLRVTARQPISFRDPESTLGVLYRQHIAAE
jgi:hypothetical protein